MLIGAFPLHPDGLDNPRRDYLKGRFVVALIAGIFASARPTLLVFNLWKERRGLRGRLEGGDLLQQKRRGGVSRKGGGCSSSSAFFGFLG